MKSQDKDFSSNKGTFLAIALCVGLYLAWNQYLTRKYPGFGQKKDTPAQVSDSHSTPLNSTASNNIITDSNRTEKQSPITTDVPVVSTPAMDLKDLIVDTKDYVIQFDQNLGSPTSIQLKNYRATNTKESSIVELLARPASIQGFSAEAPQKTSKLPFSGSKTSDGLIFTRSDGTWTIQQQWILPQEGYAAKLKIIFTNNSQDTKPLTATVLTEMGASVEQGGTSLFSPGQPGEKPRFLTQTDGSDDFKNLEGFCKDQTMEVISKEQKLDFYGIDSHYFLFALVPDGKANYRTSFSGRGQGTSSLCEILTTSVTNLGNVAPQKSAILQYDVWFGPKEVELLSQFNPHLKTTLGLGWLDMIAHPLLLSIKGLYKFTGNYGIAIILLTFLLKILFFPLTKQAAQSAAKMKKLNPEMAKIRERLKGDQQKMQMELMKFMSANKINPMKGCLPILPTIPVFFALFRVLSASIELRHAPFYGWILDLSAKDPFLITPIILTGCMFIQQRLTPMTGVDKSQERIMMFMPIIFGVMMITLPSGLVLYMLTNTLVSIAQQQYLNRKFANI